MNTNVFRLRYFLIFRFSLDGAQFYFRQRCLFSLPLVIIYMELPIILIVIFSFSSKYIFLTLPNFIKIKIYYVYLS